MAIIKPLLTKIWAKDAGATDLESPTDTKYNEGWIYGEKPPNKWMNWLQWTFSKAFAHLNEVGVLEHDTETDYLQGAFVSKNGKVYKARQSNTNQDVLLTDYWQEQSLPDMPISGNGFVLYYSGSKLFWKDPKELTYTGYEGRVASTQSSLIVPNDNVLGNDPLPDEINTGELAVNFKDRVLYTKTPEGDIVALSGSASIVDWEFTLTEGQTTVQPLGGYQVNQIEVFLNGRKLQKSAYTANDSINVTLTSAGKKDDLMVVSVWGSFSIANTYTQAQIDAMLQDAVPKGSIITMASQTPPSGYLECNGASLLVADYQELFDVIGYVYGGGGTNFSLPDLRGEFVRGFDNGKGTDSGRVFGSSQLDEFKSHSHTFTTYYRDENSMTNRVDGSTGNDNARTFTVNATGGSETRPRNIALMYCIKY